MRVVSHNLVNFNDFEDSGRYAFEWILSQDGIDKSILMTND